MLPDQAHCAAGQPKSARNLRQLHLPRRLRYSLIKMSVAYIALGSNLLSPAGPPEATLAAAVERLAAIGRITARSSL